MNGKNDENGDLNAQKDAGDPKKMIIADFDEQDYSLTRWKSLLVRTTEMQSMASTCSPLMTHAVGEDITKGLSEIIEYIRRTKSPQIPDFKLVDSKMQGVNALVGQAIDSYLVERRSSGGNQYKRMYKISKVIASCSILVAVLAILSEWYPAWF